MTSVAWSPPDMVRVKVCGHTREEDVVASIDAGVDAVGVISDVPVDTPREVDVRTARTLLADLPPFVSGVLVTMAEDPADVITLVEAVSPDALQLHAGLGVEAIGRVQDALDVPVIVAAGVEDVDRIESVDRVSDAILLDSRGESGAGGTGRTHDWNRAREIRTTVDSPVVLAGGLTPENVAEAVEAVEPYAVDVASGVESVGGVKDHRNVGRFVDRSRTPGVAAERTGGVPDA